MELVLPRIDQPLLNALSARGFDPHIVEHGDAPRELVFSLLAPGALVSTGGSTTLEENGLLDELRASKRFRYGNLEWLAEDDAERRREVRKRTVIFADAFVGSVQAVARTGQVVGCDELVIYDREPVPGRTTIALVGETLGY